MRRTNAVWSHVTHGWKNGRGAAGAGGGGRGSSSDSRPDMRRQYSIATRPAWAGDPRSSAASRWRPERKVAGETTSRHIGLLTCLDHSPTTPFAFPVEQALRDRRAVDVDERPARAETRAMDGAGHQTLARARLSREENGRQAAPFSRRARRRRI